VNEGTAGPALTALVGLARTAAVTGGLPQRGRTCSTRKTNPDEVNMGLKTSTSC
jgi:hypothetical protein